MISSSQCFGSFKVPLRLWVEAFGARASGSYAVTKVRGVSRSAAKGGASAPPLEFLHFVAANAHSRRVGSGAGRNPRMLCDKPAEQAADCSPQRQLWDGTPVRISVSPGGAAEMSGGQSTGQPWDPSTYHTSFAMAPPLGLDAFRGPGAGPLSFLRPLRGFGLSGLAQTHSLRCGLQAIARFAGFRLAGSLVGELRRCLELGALGHSGLSNVETPGRGFSPATELR